MSIYEARWRNALRVAHNMQAANRKGVEFMDHRGWYVRGFRITDAGIWYSTGMAPDLEWDVFFLNDVTKRAGMERKVDEFNAQFKTWQVIVRTNINEINRLGRLK